MQLQLSMDKLISYLVLELLIVLLELSYKLDLLVKLDTLLSVSPILQEETQSLDQLDVTHVLDLHLPQEPTLMLLSLDMFLVSLHLLQPSPPLLTLSPLKI
jgi:hypothetical protein